MPTRNGGERADAIEQVIAEVGLANVETILASYRKFVEKVDYRKLVDWSVKQPLDELLQPLFLAALVVIVRDLGLGEVAEQLEGHADGDRPGWSWDWATRFSADGGREYVHPADESTARELAAARASNSGRWTLVRRAIGPWVEVRDA